MVSVLFKTNIKCSGCVNKATPFLNETIGEDNWEVDVNTPDKVLTISNEAVSAEQVKQAVEKAGFTAVEIH
ncbi:heavy-metal-associated domain-containing protein [Pseudoflavitalea sp. G-6-1-2]|uniref:heavy-metal-associated domain-containing protein n=1 Tax=Pseudoflavitalea sp. G-6-1-2 TaxID=2728841 RepID=UPI00146C789C|nr:heavy-metal-associated domain-containing protein [Pseudoflavitalea sp. G-6-1-2]NML22599.1 heavy-metal-associated domain-containing protein [Pseudoflavitalea sp. G-6-1-2]